MLWEVYGVFWCNTRIWIFYHNGWLSFFHILWRQPSSILWRNQYLIHLFLSFFAHNIVCSSMTLIWEWKGQNSAPSNIMFKFHTATKLHRRADNQPFWQNIWQNALGYYVQKHSCISLIKKKSTNIEQLITKNAWHAMISILRKRR